jgi:hypothetical protein
MRFPRFAVVMYYKQQGQENWNEWGNITRGESTIFRTLNNVVPGIYEVLGFDVDYGIGRWHGSYRQK